MQTFPITFKNNVMERLVNKMVPTSLVGVDSNAFSIMGHFQKEARKSGWTKQEIDLIINEATSGGYDHLVTTIVSYCEEDSVEAKQFMDDEE